MQLKISEFIININNIPLEIKNSSYYNTVENIFGIKKKGLNDIDISIISNIVIPIELQKRSEALYGENNNEIYISTNFFDIHFSIKTWKCNLLLKKESKSFFYILKAVKILLSQYIITKGGIPLHSSSIATPKGTFAFIGESGSGKTTISLLLGEKPNKILNDEFNIIIPKNKEYNIYSSPFTTEDKLKFSNNISSPLQSIYAIYKSNSNYLSKINTKEATKLLIKNTYTYHTVAEIANQLLINIENIQSKIFMSKLYFINNSTFFSDFKNIRKNII